MSEHVLQITAMDKVRLARDAKRPTARDFIALMIDDFIELSGDRMALDDGAILAGLGFLGGQAVTIIGQQKGRSLEENSKRNFAMPQPEGYRKAMRLAIQAEKFKRPILTLVDTPGAYCGVTAEEHGQAAAIAESLKLFSSLRCPSLSIVIGEGGSGGALALSVTDEIWMLEHSVYSVLSPEGFASILWKDAGRAAEAAELMKLSAQDLHAAALVDRVFSEERSLEILALDLKTSAIDFFAQQLKLSQENLLERRKRKFRGRNWGI